MCLASFDTPSDEYELAHGGKATPGRDRCSTERDADLIEWDALVARFNLQPFAEVEGVAYIQRTRSTGDLTTH